jgi:1-acyl-sn-glycerol-3-phosphate acyltransferase
MAAVAHVAFRRFETSGRELFPACGPALVVANHPAAWTDVVVLDVALRRKLRFVAHERLFHPWIRGLLLKLHASLPVRYRHEDPESEAMNRATFDRCHELFRRGGAIVMFPEGVSGSDRVVRELKTGAARMVLEHVAAGGEAPALIPVGILYEDRTMFRTRVDVAVGRSPTRSRTRSRRRSGWRWRGRAPPARPRTPPSHLPAAAGGARPRPWRAPSPWRASPCTCRPRGRPNGSRAR